jgi:hypothetical protein
MSDIYYEASVYSRVVNYKTPKGESNTIELHFALDPMALMEVLGKVTLKPVKSGNPARRNETEDLEPDEQIKLIRDLASRAAGYWSEDGEEWIPIENFGNKIFGMAFLTKLTSSDGDRKEFSEKVLLDPFRAFVGYAESDASNSQVEIKGYKDMLAQMENIFKVPEAKDETLDEKKARLAAEMAALNAAPADE